MLYIQDIKKCVVNVSDCCIPLECQFGETSCKQRKSQLENVSINERIKLKKQKKDP